MTLAFVYKWTADRSAIATDISLKGNYSGLAAWDALSVLGLVAVTSAENLIINGVLPSSGEPWFVLTLVAGWLVLKDARYLFLSGCRTTSRRLSEVRFRSSRSEQDDAHYSRMWAGPAVEPVCWFVYGYAAMFESLLEDMTRWGRVVTHFTVFAALCDARRLALLTRIDLRVFYSLFRQICFTDFSYSQHPCLSQGACACACQQACVLPFCVNVYCREIKILNKIPIHIQILPVEWRIPIFFLLTLTSIFKVKLLHFIR